MEISGKVKINFRQQALEAAIINELHKIKEFQINIINDKISNIQENIIYSERFGTTEYAVNKLVMLTKLKTIISDVNNLANIDVETLYNLYAHIQENPKCYIDVNFENNILSYSVSDKVKS